MIPLRPQARPRMLLTLRNRRSLPVGISDPHALEQGLAHRGETPAATETRLVDQNPTVRQRKTGRPVKFELTDQTREAVDDDLRIEGKEPGEFLVTGNGRSGHAMTTRQYARLVSRWVASIGLDAKLFGTHSLRRTKATLIYRRTGNLRAVQLLLGHTKIESTVRYLGIEVDDALAIAEQTEI